MKVLVMGGTRFNGLALVHELVRAGHDVTTFNRGITEATLPRGVRRLYGDRTDRARLREVLGGEEFDAIHDLSAYTPADVQSMAELFRGRTGHYIFASSTVIYAASKVLPITEDFPVDTSEKQIEYGLNKIACERYLVQQWREHGFPATSVPFASVFGPHNMIPDREQRMFIRLLRGRKVLIPGDGSTLGQIGHVDDEARALRMMMLNPITFGKRYNLTGKEYFSDEGYVDVIAEVIGVTPQKVFVPPAIMDDIWSGRMRLGEVATRENRGAGGGSHIVQVSQLVQRSAANIHWWDQNVVFSIDRLRRDIGWEPDYTFRGAVLQTFDWFMREGLDKTRQFDFSMEDELLDRLASQPARQHG